MAKQRIGATVGRRTNGQYCDRCAVGFDKWSLIPVGAVALGMLLHEIPGWITCAILDLKLWIARKKDD